MKFILFSIFTSFCLNVDLKTLKAMLDRGLDEVQPKKETKMYIYQRARLDITQNNLVQLNYGLNNETFTSQTPMNFKIDLQWPDVLINMNSKGCLEEDSCKPINQNDKENKNYQGIPFTYFNANGFLGINRIRPGELDVNSISEVQNFLKLPIQFYDNSNQMTQNILGLAPNSKVWEFWQSIYHFPSKRINISMIFKQDHPFLIFDSNINEDTEILFKVKKNLKNYLFEAKIDFQDEFKNYTDKPTFVCIANQLDQTMRLNEELFDSIKKSLCKNPGDCGKVSDLKENPIFSIKLKMQDHKRAEDYFTSIFFVNSLYKIKGEEIVWKIAQTSESEIAEGCHIILEQNFLQEKQLMISNNLEDAENLYIGFKLIDPSDFSKLNFYSIIMVLMFLLTISLLVIYIILNNSLNRLLKKENMD